MPDLVTKALVEPLGIRIGRDRLADLGPTGRAGCVAGPGREPRAQTSAAATSCSRSKIPMLSVARSKLGRSQSDSMSSCDTSRTPIASSSHVAYSSYAAATSSRRRGRTVKPNVLGWGSSLNPGRAGVARSAVGGGVGSDTRFSVILRSCPRQTLFRPRAWRVRSSVAWSNPWSKSPSSESPPCESPPSESRGLNPRGPNHCVE